MNANNNDSSPYPGSPAAQVSERPTLTSNSQQGQHNEKTNHARTAGAATRSGKATSENNNVIAFTLNWICVVLTVAATIVFGIWAPLSYRATADGNRDNNEVQNSVMHQVMTANGIASSALDAVSAQCTALDSMQDRLNAMGQLAMVDFCLTQTAVECSYFVSNVPLTSVLSYLASATPPSGTSTSISLSSSSTSTFYQTTSMSSPTLSSTQSEAATPYPKSNSTIDFPSPPTTYRPPQSKGELTESSTVSAATTAGPLTAANVSHSSINPPTPSSSVSTAPSPSPSTAANTSHLPVEAVLGIVFGLLTFLGLVAGFIVWQVQKRRVATVFVDR